MANVQYYGTGRRKHSVARVRLVAGEGNIIVNGRAVEEYFNYETLIRDIKSWWRVKRSFKERRILN